VDHPYTTIQLAVDHELPDPGAIVQAAQAIRDGDVVAFPTETVYGLGADALNPQAVERVFQAKGRPADNPLIVHVASVDEVESLTLSVPAAARILAAHFWPGPLTMVFRRSSIVPDITTAGLETVAVRVPAHPVARALLEASGKPIAAPSANRSGRPSPTCASHVLDDLGGWVRFILNAGPCSVGVESTVIDVTEEPPVLLRPGGVPIEELEAVVGEIRSLQGKSAASSRSPGTRHRHYAPQATVLVAPGGCAEALAVQLLQEGKTVGLMTQLPVETKHPDLRVLMLPQGLAQYAARLFSALRDLDALGCN
jgi:L-threonylcarbamoyladenylate synthase